MANTHFLGFSPSPNFVKGNASQTETSYKGANKKRRFWNNRIDAKLYSVKLEKMYAEHCPQLNNFKF